MKCELGRVNGIEYKLVYDRMCNQGAWHWRRFRWFLSSKYPDEHFEFEGDFGTKREAMEFLKTRSGLRRKAGASDFQENSN
jgi:hypothetical protein